MGRPSRWRSRRSVDEMSRRGMETRSTRQSGPGGSECTSPARSTTTTVARWRVSSSRRQVGMFATASAPSTRKSSRPGADSASSVSAVTDASPRSISIADASMPSMPSTAMAASASRSAACATTRPRFCHGSPATTSSTRSRPSWARVSAATTTCPTWTGSNVPPNTPSRSPVIGGVYERVVHSPARNIRVIFPRSIVQVSDASEPVTHVLVRVWLPDRPGALGLVASRIGAVDGDIVGIDVLERGDNVAVDEFAVLLRKSVAIDLLVREIEEVDGASVEQVRTIDRFPDPRLDALASAASLCASTSVDALHAAVVDQVQGEFMADWSALLRDATLLAAAGDNTPDASVLEALVAGTAASPRVADGTTGPDDLAVASLPDHGAALLVGRDGRAFRRRERAQLSALAAIADRTWALLA